MLDAITWETGIPGYVPIDADAFTLDDHIYYKEGYQPVGNSLSLYQVALTGHEVTHSQQYRQNGSLRQKGSYLFESAKKGLAGYLRGGTYAGPTIASLESYYGNKYEQEAIAMQNRIVADLAKNGNPCP